MSKKTKIENLLCFDTDVDTKIECVTECIVCCVLLAF